MTSPDATGPDIEGVAAGLSDTAKSDLLTGCCKVEGNDHCVCRSPARQELADARLVKLTETSVDVGWLLNKRAYAVRAHLLESSNHGE